MNKAILVGNLARDPELKVTTTGKNVCRFSIAVNRRFKDADGTHKADYLNIVAWNQTADLCAKYLAKGRKVGVVGEIQTRSYEAQDGTKRYVTEIVASEVEFLSPKGEQGGSAAAYANSSENPNSPEFPDGSEIDDDELPF